MSYSGYICCILMIALALWDAVSLTFFGLPGTVSVAMQHLGLNCPAFVFACGFLFGHFFAAMPVTKPRN